ncbi:hypothetical protein FIU94_11385 [Sulfitobacter sp. THAF37]|uniref:hypothetical protein n=1 Tax=Sulfitobacter sp. THAF37 TaxID=2587855 RepID=UPI0012685DD0|nr:hypothetical protein [Sulfitobacter sp. THAF37]QFT59426.1 hypothetical protein FIU94_11385 [Sulfitobacter sp. THAF37]
MKIIFSGPNDTVAYWNGVKTGSGARMFCAGRARALDIERGFARLSAFGANGNHAPSGAEGAITADCGIGLLYQIAGCG